ncbi:MAG: pantoate--beta-alanine ligase [Deltaproteobacteria bacterium RBG_13_43_22]|nr:MAG: pantoate--beta-alanine ligase [Deltaproteobacteria bacterium RBG_13_43_22]
MEIIRDIEKMQSRAEKTRQGGKRIALVPTMGALHEGHLALMDYGREKANLLVVSIFVNPIQFGPKEDFEKYPRDLQKDSRLTEKRGVDLIFSPEIKAFYPEFFQTYVTVEKVTQNLCGASRPGHFRGVTTVVCKLFNIVKPHLAIFGQKDFQQLIAIQQMVEDLHMDVEVVGRPTIREDDGLAMSSRNVFLSPEERISARSLFQAMQEGQSLFRMGERKTEVLLNRVRGLIMEQPFTRIDYAKICHPRTLEEVKVVEGRGVLALAVWVGATRLIDNCLLEDKGQ